MIIIDPQRRWRHDLGGGAQLATWVGHPPPPLGHLPSFRARFASDLFLESSHIFQIIEKLCVALLSLCKPNMWAFLGSFQLTPYRNKPYI
jgi:hypothetical protein